MVKHNFFNKVFALTIVALLLSVPLFLTAAKGDLIFSDGFESGTFDNWTSPNGTPTIVTTPVHSGSYAANFSYATSSCYEMKTIDPTNTLNYTYYVYFGALPTNYLCVVMAEDTNNNEIYFRVQSYNGGYQWQFDAGNGQVVNASTQAPQTGQWYKIQLLAMTGDNSTFYFLVNDELTATITNQTLGQINQLRVGNDWIDFGSYMPQGETYFDDVVATDALTPFISAFAGDDGSITPSGAVSVAFDGSQTFDITANANYHIADVLVDGFSVAPRQHIYLQQCPFSREHFCHLCD